MSCIHGNFCSLGFVYREKNNMDWIFGNGNQKQQRYTLQNQPTLSYNIVFYHKVRIVKSSTQFGIYVYTTKSWCFLVEIIFRQIFIHNQSFQEEHHIGRCRCIMPMVQRLTRDNCTSVVFVQDDRANMEGMVQG